MSDLFENHIVGFPMRPLSYHLQLCFFAYTTKRQCSSSSHDTALSTCSFETVKHLLRPYVVVNLTEIHYLRHHKSREDGGIVVEHQTMNREFLGSIPTGGTVLCP